MPQNSQNSVHVRLTPEERVTLDEWRRRQRDLPSKPEAMRRALAIAARQADETGDEAAAA